jgi:hypothetical protein
MFDHTLVIAQDDPYLDIFKGMAVYGLQDQGGMCDLRVVDGVGCEKFAEIAFNVLNEIIKTYQSGKAWHLKNQQGGTLQTFENRYPVGQGVRLRSVKVFEHGANAAVYEG